MIYDLIIVFINDENDNEFRRIIKIKIKMIVNFMKICENDNECDENDNEFRNKNILKLVNENDNMIFMHILKLEVRDAAFGRRGRNG